MTAQEIRGKRLFLMLASIIITSKLAGIGLTLSRGLTELNWNKSIAQPLAFAGAVACLWWGSIFTRWLVGLSCLLSGGLQVLVAVRLLVKLAERTPLEATGFFLQVAVFPIGVFGLFGLLYCLAGLLFLFSPSMRAFFQYQQEGIKVWIESE